MQYRWFHLFRVPCVLLFVCRLGLPFLAFERDYPEVRKVLWFATTVVVKVGGADKAAPVPSFLGFPKEA